MIVNYKLFESRFGEYNVAIEGTVYSLSEEQYKKAKQLIDEKHKDEDNFYEGLRYIVKVGKKIIELDGEYNF
jgi:L-rhamnose isomerase